MRADMREKITFKSRSTAQNYYGEEVSWTVITTVWGSIEPLLGREYFSAEMVSSQVEVKFRCWYFPGLINTMRVTHAGVDYDILSAINVKSQNREWLIYAKKVTE